MMMRPVNRTFQLRPKTVNGVCMAATTDELFSPVVHLLMLVTQRASEVVGRMLVSVQSGSRLNRGANVPNQIGSVHGWNDFGNNSTPAIGHANHSSLASRATAPLTRSATANVGFIRFAFAKEFGGFIIHQLANFMSHAPRRLIGHAKLPFQFLSRNPVPACGHQEDGKEPRNEARSRFVEDCASRGVKLIPAPGTAIRTAFLNRIKAILFPALRASAAIRPPSLEQEIKTGAVIGELIPKIK